MRRWRWRDPRRAAVIGLVAAVVLVLAVAGRLGVASPGHTPWRPVPPATATGPSTVESVPPTIMAAMVGKPVDRSVDACQLALAAGSLWVAAQASDQVVRVDPTSGLASAVIPVRQPLGIAAGFGAVWVTSYGEHPALLRIDPASLRVTARTPLDVAAAVAAGAGAVWVACGGQRAERAARRPGQWPRDRTYRAGQPGGDRLRVVKRGRLGRRVWVGDKSVAPPCGSSQTASKTVTGPAQATAGGFALPGGIDGSSLRRDPAVLVERIGARTARRARTWHPPGRSPS